MHHISIHIANHPIFEDIKKEGHEKLTNLNWIDSIYIPLVFLGEHGRLTLRERLAINEVIKEVIQNHSEIPFTISKHAQFTSNSTIAVLGVKSKNNKDKKDKIEALQKDLYDNIKIALKKLKWDETKLKEIDCTKPHISIVEKIGEDDKTPKAGGKIPMSKVEKSVIETFAESISVKSKNKEKPYPTLVEIGFFKDNQNLTVIAAPKDNMDPSNGESADNADKSESRSDNSGSQGCSKRAEQFYKLKSLNAVESDNKVARESIVVEKKEVKEKLSVANGNDNTIEENGKDKTKDNTKEKKENNGKLPGKSKDKKLSLDDIDASDTVGSFDGLGLSLDNEDHPIYGKNSNGSQDKAADVPSNISAVPLNVSRIKDKAKPKRKHQVRASQYELVGLRDDALMFSLQQLQGKKLDPNVKVEKQDIDKLEPEDEIPVYNLILDANAKAPEASVAAKKETTAANPIKTPEIDKASVSSVQAKKPAEPAANPKAPANSVAVAAKKETTAANPKSADNAQAKKPVVANPPAKKQAVIANAKATNAVVNEDDNAKTLPLDPSALSSLPVPPKRVAKEPKGSIMDKLLPKEQKKELKEQKKELIFSKAPNSNNGSNSNIAPEPKKEAKVTSAPKAEPSNKAESANVPNISKMTTEQQLQYLKLKRQKLMSLSKPAETPGGSKDKNQKLV